MIPNIQAYLSQWNWGVKTMDAFWFGFFLGAGLVALVVVRRYRCLNAHCGFWTFRPRRMLHHVQRNHRVADYGLPYYSPPYRGI